MDMQIAGKTAIITGGTLGIGRSIVEMFADEGVNVAFSARDAGRIADAVSALRAKGVNAFGRVVDAADAAATKCFVDDVAEEFGGVDIFVANASGLTHGSDITAWKLAFDIDVMGAVHAADTVFPYLLKAAKAKGDASFLTLSSTAATQAGQPDAYGAAKAALMNFTKGLSRAHTPAGVRSNTIVPGPVFAEGGSWDRIKQHAPEQYEMVASLCPMGRMGRPEEIAAAAVFLSSPLSAFTSGIALVIDGSMSYRVNY